MSSIAAFVDVVSSGQCGHAASSWVKKSGGGEEVFMIKSIVG